MDLSFPSSETLVVVDSDSSDYTAVEQWAAAQQWEFHLVHSGHRALRLARNVGVDVWIVNVRLPDVSGCDLVDMLRPDARASAVFMVADQYRAEDEIRALSLGVTQYLCKPLESAVLDQWRAAQLARRAKPKE